MGRPNLRRGAMALTHEQIDTAITAVAQQDAAVARWLAHVGTPQPRVLPHGYETLFRALVSQQISVAAARGILAKLEAMLGDITDPVRVLAASDEMLRSGGLSRQKIGYARALADAVVSGALDFDALPALDDEAAIARISAIRGFGRWSAQMYLMFAEGRTDLWAPDDMALQEGVRRLCGLAERPKPKATLALVEPWRPHRTAMALFCWHVYAAKAPL
jgi:DNA-3-methyladenine glycosylase II